MDTTQHPAPTTPAPEQGAGVFVDRAERRRRAREDAKERNRLELFTRNGTMQVCPIFVPHQHRVVFTRWLRRQLTKSDADKLQEATEAIREANGLDRVSVETQKQTVEETPVKVTAIPG